MKIRAALVCLATAACAAPGAWENPNLDPGRRSLDMAECRSRAEAKAEKEYIRDQDIGQPDQWQSAMARFDAEKRTQALYAHCMNTKGYARAAKDDPL